MESPTPPQPNTATVEPGRTFAVRSAAPTPVLTPQPTSAAALKSTSFSILDVQMAGTTAYSAMFPRKVITAIGLPSSFTRLVPSRSQPSGFATVHR